MGPLTKREIRKFLHMRSQPSNKQWRKLVKYPVLVWGFSYFIFWWVVVPRCEFFKGFMPLANMPLCVSWIWHGLLIHRQFVTDVGVGLFRGSSTQDWCNKLPKEMNQTWNYPDPRNSPTRKVLLKMIMMFLLRKGYGLVPWVRVYFFRCTSRLNLKGVFI